MTEGIINEEVEGKNVPFQAQPVLCGMEYVEKYEGKHVEAHQVSKLIKNM